MINLLPRPLRLAATLRHTLLPRYPLPSTQTAPISEKAIAHRASKSKDIPQRPHYGFIPPPPPTKTPEQQGSELSYVVRRTVSEGLPVYRKWKSGNTRQIILVKKVEGDRRKFVGDLVEGMGVTRDTVRINSTTQHIEIQGDYLDKTKEWLLQKGF